jgi:hypothetical protein
MMKNSTRIERLNKLIEVVQLHVGKRGKPVQLNGVSRKWNMDTWDCGTSACALGSAALTPWFRRRGLTIKDYTPSCKGENGLFAAVNFFGISYTEADSIFSPSHYRFYSYRGHELVIDEIKVPPTKVIKHIKEVIERYG